MAYDVFICHASEDKVDVARPLTEVLRSRGRTVWIDELQMKLGDSLRQRIDEGLRESRFGVVILSPNFFAKRWPQWELDGLAQREVISGQKVVLPVWHQITGAEVASFSPLLAGRLAASTDGGLETVADEIDAVFDSTAAPTTPNPSSAFIAASLGPLLVLAPPSQHRLNDHHAVTPPPQQMWAQTAVIDVENVGPSIAFISGAGADQTGIGGITVRPPAAIAPHTARPVELIVSTMGREVHVTAGQQFRFWLDYGAHKQPDRRLWGVARYNGGGGWENLGSENGSLANPSETL